MKTSLAKKCKAYDLSVSNVLKLSGITYSMLNRWNTINACTVDILLKGISLAPGMCKQEAINVVEYCEQHHGIDLHELAQITRLPKPTLSSFWYNKRAAFEYLCYGSFARPNLTINF
jgi:hypothetical protein